MRYFLILLLTTFVSAECIAQDSAFDQGIRDTFTIAPTTVEIGQSETVLKLEIWVFSDETIIAFSGMFGWDNPKVRIDSAMISPLLLDLDFAVFLFDKDNIDSSNANRIFQVGGLASSHNLEGSSTRRLWATYYLTLSDWHAGDSVKFDILSGNEAELSFVTYGPFSPVEFNPEFPGPMKISGIETGIDYNDVNLPTNFVLYQNYPNPFNPATTIQFELNKASDISLSVFNITGQEVTNIFHGHLSPGPHTFIWNGHADSGLEMPSGIYLYKLVADDHSQSKKMLLVR